MPQKPIPRLSTNGKPAPKPRAEKLPKSSAAEASPGQAADQKLSALDAAARVLAEVNEPMTCQEMITVMAAKGYWTSPGGKTPAATLSSAIIREIRTKGAQARFQKTERGKFAHI